MDNIILVNFKKIYSTPDNQFSLVVIPGSEWNKALEGSLADLSSCYNVYILDSELPSSKELEGYAEAALGSLREIGVLRATILGISEGGSLAQAMVLANKKMLRRLILINGTCRMSPGLGSRIIDYLEAALPFGLPLRSLDKNYDSRPFAHRIDCPVLLLTTDSASPYERGQGQFLANRLPNVWVSNVLSLTNGSKEVLNPEILKAVSDFLDIPARKPQKREANKEARVNSS